MPIADIAIAIAIVVSVAVGFFRGFVKEAISIATLVVAIWAALNFGTYAGQWTETWVSSQGLQLWAGRILVFVVVLIVGGLIGWAFSRLVRLSALNGTDRSLGGLFGFCRGALLLGVLVIGGQMATFDKDLWWQESKLIPYGGKIADWIRVMAPKGVDMLQNKHAPEGSAAERAGLDSA